MTPILLSTSSLLLAGLALLLSQEARLPADDLPEVLPATAPTGLPEAIPGVSSTEAEARRATLGRRLFFDPVLSADRTVACASCHRPALGFADADPVSTGVAGRKTKRNAPTLFNRAYGTSFMWDGQAETLEEQVLLPIENELEMNLSLEDAVGRLKEDEDYAAGFLEAFEAAPSRETLAVALAAFVRRLVLGDSPVDRFRAGEFEALSPSERAGLWFYESRGGCWRCHSGANFTDEEFHNTGVGAKADGLEDGRFALTGEDRDRGRFKTPTLRGLTLTAPYMHDGSMQTLEEVVTFYREGGRKNPHLDPDVRPIEMNDEDARNLVAFLRALSRTTDR